MGKNKDKNLRSGVGYWLRYNRQKYPDQSGLELRQIFWRQKLGLAPPPQDLRTGRSRRAFRIRPLILIKPLLSGDGYAIDFDFNGDRRKERALSSLQKKYGLTFETPLSAEAMTCIQKDNDRTQKILEQGQRELTRLGKAIKLERMEKDSK